MSGRYLVAAGLTALAGLIGRGAFVGAQPVRASAPGARAMDDTGAARLTAIQRSVAVRGGGYFPVLIRLKDGRLGAVVRGGAPHIGIRGRLDWITSADGGKTWSAPSLIVDSRWDDRNPAAGQMPDGTIVVAYAEARTYNAAGEWDPSAGEYEVFYVLSRDGGRTWTNKRKLFTGPIRGGSPFGRIVVLGDGTALLSLYGRPDPDQRDRYALPKAAKELTGLVRSRDNGKTWGDFSLVSAGGHNEMSLLALTDKKLLAAVRTTRGSVDLFRSGDGGYHWRGPTPITQAGQHPADLCRLRSGRVLMVYGNRRAPLGVGAIVSTDDGRSWDYAHRVMLAWDSLSGDCGYPSAVTFGDGTIVVMYYSVGTRSLGTDAMALVVRLREADLLTAMTDVATPAPSTGPSND